MILNQVDTGLACPREVRAMKERIPEGSLMCYVKVHAFVLAKVLDRLEALEKFEEVVITASKNLAKGAHKHL